MDSQLFFNALTNSSNAGSPFDMLVQDCKVLYANSHNIVFSLVRRSANSIAHLVAKVSGSLSGPRVWNAIPHIFVLNTLLHDRI